MTTPRRSAGLAPPNRLTRLLGACRTRCSTRLASPGLIARGRWLGRLQRWLFSQQRNLGKATLRNGSHHLHDAAVCEVFVTAHEDPPLLVILCNRLELRNQLRQLD